MKFLIMTIATGQGHNKTAKSLSRAVTDSGNEALVIDALEYINPQLKNIVSKIYELSTTISPKTYGTLYRLVETEENPESKITVQKITTALLSKKITDFISEYAPDCIICTHVFAAMLITNVKHGKIEVPTAGIITDFTIHPYWDETELDYYVLPDNLLKYQALKKNIPEEKLIGTGIPISPEFSVKKNKSEIRKYMNIPDKTTILIMSGSMGFGNIFEHIESIDALDEDIQTITVCGNNKSMKEKIDNAGFKKNILNYGYTDNIPQLMDVADYIITKPGGISVSEALAKELPIIIINPIPGQEDRNSEFLLNCGAAIKCTKTCPADEIIYNLIHNPDLTAALNDNIRRLRKPDAAKDLVEFLIKKANTECKN